MATLYFQSCGTDIDSFVPRIAKRRRRGSDICAALRTIGLPTWQPVRLLLPRFQPSRLAAVHLVLPRLRLLRSPQHQQPTRVQQQYRLRTGRPETRPQKAGKSSKPPRQVALAPLCRDFMSSLAAVRRRREGFGKARVDVEQRSSVHPSIQARLREQGVALHPAQDHGGRRPRGVQQARTSG